MQSVSNDDMRVVFIQWSTREALFPTAVTPVDRSVSVRVYGIRNKTSSPNGRSSEVYALSYASAYGVALHVFHSKSRVHPTPMTYQPRPETTVCQQLGSIAYLKAQPHHHHLFLKRPDSTFGRIRLTVVPGRSLQDNQIRKKSSFNFPA